MQNAGGEALFEGGGPGGEKSAQARAEEHQLRGIHLGQGQRVVHHRRDHLLPVGPEDQSLFASYRLLAGPFEGEHVVPPAQCARADHEVELLQRGVVPAVVDQGRTGLARRPGEEQIPRQGGALVRDLLALRRDVEQLGGPGEGRA